MPKVPTSVTHKSLDTHGSVGDQLMVSEKNFFIDFFHIPTGKCVSFKGFLTQFDDNFQSDWTSENVYGRMDPIMTYQQTVRSISLGWDVVAASMQEAQANLHAVEHLLSMLYPVYNRGSFNTLQAAPLLKIKFANLIRQPNAKGEDPYAGKGGLVAAVQGFNYSPNIEPGFYLPGSGTMYPKHIPMQCQFTVLHTHKLGFEASGKWRGDKGANRQAFPYGVDDLTGHFSKCNPQTGQPLKTVAKSKRNTPGSTTEKVADANTKNALKRQRQKGR